MDAERIVADHLSAHGVGAGVYYDVPDRPPDSFAVVQRTGGSPGELALEVAMVDVQCWAGSRRDAATLAEAVTAAVRAMPEEVDNVFAVEFSGTSRDRDLETGKPRYHVVFQFTYSE